jgi:hypothetical protein
MKQTPLKTTILAVFLSVLALRAVHAEGTHVFILSGQSNMAGMRPAESFTPAVTKAYGAENVVVVHDAHGGQPIRRWYKGWELRKEDKPQFIGDLYTRLIEKVKPAIAGKKVDSVTFFWMQGERDAREELGDRYAESFHGILDQLRSDLRRKDLNFVIGRLSDFDMENKKYPEWTRIRDIQVKLAESHWRGAWINTDDLNDGTNRGGKPINNDLHMSAEGYKIMGTRFAEQGIALIAQQQQGK